MIKFSDLILPRNYWLSALLLMLTYCLSDLPFSKKELSLLQYLFYDYPDISITISNTNIAEGNNQTISIKLTSEPSEKVVIPITPLSSLIVTSKQSLTFTKDNWNQPQSFTVSAPEDLYYEPDDEVLIQFGPYESGDALYNGKTRMVSFFYINNDPLGFNIFITGPTEGGPDGSVNISLLSQPRDNVTISFSNPSSLDLNFSSYTFTFTPSNWNIAQTITASAIDDTDIEYTETFTMNFTGSSNDPFYNQYTQSSSIDVFDNDIYGLIFSVSSFSIQEGNSQNVGIRLIAQPTSNVTVSISSSPTALCTISAGSSLTFTPTNYNTYQNFTIQAKAADNIDNIAETPTNCTITATTTSSDPNYNALSKNLQGEIYDLLNAGIIINNGGSTTLSPLLELGPSASFNIRLQSEPSSPVTVCLKSSNYCEAYINSAGINAPNGTCNSIAGADTPYIIFNSSNWNTNQLVLVGGRHDWNYRSPSSIPETGGNCPPPYPDGTKSFTIEIYTSCSTCNSNETPYYHTTPAPYSTTLPGTVQDNLDLYTFVTSSGHNGDFANDATLTGSNAIQKADDFCNQQNPGITGTFRALLVDGINRSACGNGSDYPTCSGKINWVLQPNRYYFRYSDEKLLFPTDGNGFFAFGFLGSNGIPGSTYIWTGIDDTPATQDWADSSYDCSNWSSTTLSGRSGKPVNTTSYNAVSDNTYSCSLSTLKLLCIQQ